ncbi:MAG: hypothetical protein JKY57_01130 [Kordiimonadaceae bacterium]|nr:hypothetical protein [Kordiimonadaceae bacterium]
MVIAALMEMGAAHILFLKLAPQAVQIADALSLATLLMIFGLLVSWRDNPIIIEHNSVKLRWGLFRKYTLSPDQILSVKAGAVDVSRPHPKNHMINAILAEPNVTLSIKPDCVFHNRIQIDHISLVADAPKELEATINGLLEANEAAG